MPSLLNYYSTFEDATAMTVGRSSISQAPPLLSSSNPFLRAPNARSQAA